MQAYLKKFDELFKGKQSIDIEFFCEEPLSKKYVRYNQSGEVCHCSEDSNKAMQRVKNGWQQIDCDTYSCQYRQKNEQGKCACNRIGWLKFLIPSISTDRIFLMKITGQTSINILDDYIKLQKAQGKSIKGHYTIFLKQIEQYNSLGQTFNNYVLDILKTEDFKSIKQIPKTIENTIKVSTNNDENVNSKAMKQEVINNIKQNTALNRDTTPGNYQKSTTTKRKTTKKTENNQETKQTKESEEDNRNAQKDDNINSDEQLKNCYVLLSTTVETLVNKKGEPKEYLIGEFADVEDKISNIVIRPEDAEELAQCDLGTVVRLDISKIGERKYAMKLEFVEKMLKKVAV